MKSKILLQHLLTLIWKKNVGENDNYCYNVKFYHTYSGHINAYCLPTKLKTS